MIPVMKYLSKRARRQRVAVALAAEHEAWHVPNYVTRREQGVDIAHAQRQRRVTTRFVSIYTTPGADHIQRQVTDT
ncbi:hypothetical protein AG1IA_02642 [Rhizoctonia solani AG-1 IA]|uniref:Uncharacterized protein n=1 Tax=Thanatephorus cucumeris (strain AG1-IA) TaxID=983506 RepID=L8X3X5_THACA|nr:hypothetical protein AG1IA_02642 [Rhizoctonia solani AG-1 IA]